MRNRYIIYALCDPDTNEIRYVGQSSIGYERPRRHWKHKLLREREDHCHSWVRSILKKDKIPKIKVLQVLKGVEGLNEAEKYWIKKLRKEGCKLTNMTDGGGGTHGMEPWCKGKKLSKEHREKISKALKGRTSPTKGRKPTKKQREGIARANKTRMTPEVREKISKANKGKIPWNKK